MTGRDDVRLGRTIVVSPHLDDAVLSLGAGIARTVRSGDRVTILTVLGGDLDSSVPAGAWDSRSGFATAGEAIRARRSEDARACALVGAVPHWLRFPDAQYGPADAAEIARALEAEVSGGQTVLAPGFPMTNPDHVLVTRALLEVVPRTARVGLYLEQPYDWWHARPERRLSFRTRWRVDPPPRTVSPGGVELVWTCLPADPRDVWAKLRACRAYASQLPLFGRWAVTRILLRETRRGGEYVAWL